AGRQPRRRRAHPAEPRVRLRHEWRPRERPESQSPGPRRGERPAPASVFHAAQGPAGRGPQRRTAAQSKLLPAIRRQWLDWPSGGTVMHVFRSRMSGIVAGVLGLAVASAALAQVPRSSIDTPATAATAATAAAAGEPQFRDPKTGYIWT